ncbi:uncharacterized protein [Haliotis cracherodii]|uniref:uncharacterized protein n=1 Tax=Haliotis cracherodii TaxID=6455 RepID=UPI0039EB01BC
MGLSRKLGGCSKPEPLSDVEYQWSTQSYTLKEILGKFKVPRVVQCASPCSVQLSEFQFDLQQPLLIYSKRYVRKAYARNLKYEKASQEMMASGPPVIIPEDYDGWFTVVNSESDTLPRHTRIETIAGCPSERFLVGTQLPVLIHTPGYDGEAQYVESDVMPGGVLRKTGTCESDEAMAEVMVTLRKGRPCLRCTDEKNDDLIIPFHHRAKMFEVSDETSPTSSGLVSMRHVIETGEALFPTVLRHMFGELPAVSYCFTGDLRLERVFHEDSVLASTLDKEAPFPLEIKTDSKVRFTIALNEADIKRTSDYNDAFCACEELGDKYLSGMKVSFTLQPEMVPLDPLDWSMSEAGSDAEDVDAKSEFEIDWDPDRTNSMINLAEKAERMPHPKPDVVLTDKHERPGEPQHSQKLEKRSGKTDLFTIDSGLKDIVSLDDMREEIV